jgi:hypothetical protein
MNAPTNPWRKQRGPRRQHRSGRRSEGTLWPILPIASPNRVERLSDPSLTTPEFHQLYRRLTGEDRRLPTYLK